MKRLSGLVCIGFSLIGTCTLAQTVTSSGTTGTVGNVPYIYAASSNSTTFSVSPISIPTGGGKVGIGTPSPAALLDVYGAIYEKGYNGLWLDGVHGNTAIGPTSLPTTVAPGGGNAGTGLTAVGVSALNANTTGGTSTAVGAYTLQKNTTGNDNNAFGFDTMNAVTTGYANNGFGWGALNYLVSGGGNAAYGHEALYSVTGNYNSAFGGGTGSGGVGRSITTGSNNSIFGFDVGETTLTTGSNNILIGTDASTDTPSSSTSNFLNIGNTIYATNMLNSTNSGGSGNVGIGTTTPGAKLEVNGGLRFTADPSGTVQTTAWTGVLCGGDYAEAVDVAGGGANYQPGDVLVLASGSESDVTKSSEPYSTLVAGIYATKPGVIGRRQSMTKSDDEVPMTMVGIVPTKVTAENGPIRRGDLLVTSSRPGYAMKGTNHNRMLGAVIGKAMGPIDSGTGVIEVLVTLQ